MTERERVLRILRDLALPDGQYLLSGSGVLVLHGIERSRPMGDLDLFVATRLWFELLYRPVPPVWSIWTTDPTDLARRVDPPYLFREMHGLEVNVFHSWRRRGVGDIDVAFWMANAELVAGVPCTSLAFMLDWKQSMGRSKDLDDILAIRAHLGVEA